MQVHENETNLLHKMRSPIRGQRSLQREAVLSGMWSYRAYERTYSNDHLQERQYIQRLLDGRWKNCYGCDNRNTRINIFIAMPHLLDRWFLSFCTFYLVNRGLIQPCFSVKYPGIANCLRDFLVVPCLCSVWLFSYRLLGIKVIHYPPTAFDLAFSWVFFSVLLEFILPTFFGLGVSDPIDVLWYAVGTILAMLVWRSKGSAASLPYIRSGDTEDEPTVAPNPTIGCF